MSTEPMDPDDLIRADLAGHNPMWKALADTLDEWNFRMHGVMSGGHHVGAFLRFLGKNGFEVAAKPRTPTELEILTAVDAGEVWHHQDLKGEVILEDDIGQCVIDDDRWRKLLHLIGESHFRYALNDKGKARLAELEAAAKTGEVSQCP